MLIAIDGSSGVGKGTVARLVALKLGFPALNTGNIYRSLGLFVVHHLGADFDWSENSLDLQSLSDQILTQLIAEFRGCFSLSVPAPEANDSSLVPCIKGKAVTDQLQSEKLGHIASTLAALPLVRCQLLIIQRQSLSRVGVAEGRDTTTVVFPDADFKFYLTATARVRAERRGQQLCQGSLRFLSEVEIKEIERSIAARDHRDRTRIIAPLIRANDAFEIDTSLITADQVADRIFEIVKGTHG